jgi:hypothetical protein
MQFDIAQPPQKDAVASDIDVLAIHPRLEGPEKVIAVSCESWQESFNPGYSLGCIAAEKHIGGPPRPRDWCNPDADPTCLVPRALAECRRWGQPILCEMGFDSALRRAIELGSVRTALTVPREAYMPSVSCKTRDSWGVARSAAGRTLYGCPGTARHPDLLFSMATRWWASSRGLTDILIEWRRMCPAKPTPGTYRPLAQRVRAASPSDHSGPDEDGSARRPVAYHLGGALLPFRARE